MTRPWAARWAGRSRSATAGSGPRATRARNTWSSRATARSSSPPRCCRPPCRPGRWPGPCPRPTACSSTGPTRKGKADMLEARGIRYLRDGQLILDGIDLTVAAGESLAVTGPSGSGKTSLLAIISGLAAPAGGEVYLDGTRLTGFAGPSAGVALVLQGYGLVSLLTAAENIEVALRAAGLPARAAQSAARAALEQLGLLDHAGQIVEELSGGQQQRVAVARALALQPRLLIADEPTAELDPAARAVVLARMFDVAATGGSLVVATHDPEVAGRCSRTLDLRVPVG